MSAGKRAPAIKEEDLRRFRPLQQFLAVLEELIERHPTAGSWEDPKRKLLLADYLGLFLFALFNPVISTMRGACAASELPRVAAQVCRRPVSLGSFSEAQHLVDEELLEAVFSRLQEQLPEREKDVPKAVWRLRALRPGVVDSSVWQVCERLHWAKWRPLTGGGGTRGDAAVRVHVVFDLLKGAPAQARLTPAKTCERKIWRQLAKPGCLYVADRYYSYDYKLLGELCAKGMFFIVRARIDTQWVLERELPVDPDGRAAGVIWSGLVRLGKDGKGPPVRVVQVEGEEKAILLLTNLAEESLDAAAVRVLYQNRWQIEYFYYWFKCILRNRHWFCGSPKGMQIQVYLALIAAVLLMLISGKRPNKRCMEAIQFFLQGWASEADLVEQLVRYA